MRTTQVELQEQEPLVEAFVDNTYWKVQGNLNVDDLLTDYE